MVLAPERNLVWYCSAPAFVIALASVSAFLLSVDERFRVTFWRRDTKREFYSRMFDTIDASVSIAEQDKDRANLLTGGSGLLLEEVRRAHRRAGGGSTGRRRGRARVGSGGAARGGA